LTSRRGGRWLKNNIAHVRFGGKADIAPAPQNVR
jgi:hypothetical protein